MGTVGDKLDYLEQTKALIAAAIEEQGVEVSEEDTFRAYAALIATIGKLPDLTAEDEGKILKVIGGTWGIGAGISADATLKIAGAAADAKATGDKFATMEKNTDDRLKPVEKAIADLLYKAISVTSFTNNVGTAEMGSTVDAVTLSWAFNKVPVAVTLDGAEQAVDSTGAALSGLGLTDNKTWTLRATDERDAVATKTTSVSFVNGVYFGCSALTAIDDALILGLTRNLRGSKLSAFTANAGAGQYIYYCHPKRYGTCTFAVGGFTGGFTLAGTVSFTNASGYTEDYYVYKSDNTGLGNTAVSVS